jgi:MerR family copper efflux transcriptional regulator
LKYAVRMRIGELAERAGVAPTTVRFYESIGLMQEPERRANGYRAYSDGDLERLRFVRDAQAAGLTLAQTREILDMKAEGEATCAHTTAMLRGHLADMDRQIESLMAARGELVSLLERADTLDPRECTGGSRCHVIGLDIPVH